MNIDRLMTFIARCGEQTAAFDSFIAVQRTVAQAVRSRDWPALERSLELASTEAEAVSLAEVNRIKAWHQFLDDAALPYDCSVFRASLALPVEYRAALNDAYRGLRMSAMRARIENDSLSGFVGSAATLLRQAVETVFPERRGRLYGKTGRPQQAETGAMILNRAL